MSNDAELIDLCNRLVDIERQYFELPDNFADNHPEYLRLRAEETECHRALITMARPTTPQGMKALASAALLLFAWKPGRKAILTDGLNEWLAAFALTAVAGTPAPIEPPRQVPFDWPDWPGEAHA